MTIEAPIDYSAEFAAEDEAIERVGQELEALRDKGVPISDQEISDVQDTLRRQPGPYVSREFSVLADLEKIWKVVRRNRASGADEQVA